MKNNTNFNDLLRLNLYEDVRKYAAWLAIGLGVIFTILIFTVQNISYEPTKLNLRFKITDPVLDIEAYYFIFGLYLTAALAASFTCANLASKPSRISNLMLPASIGKKFLLRCLIFSPCAVIAYVAGFFAIDFVRYIFVLIFKAGAGETAQLFISCFPDIFHEEILYYVFFLMILVSHQAVYTLGSAIWPRKAFLLTFASLFVLWAAATFVAIAMVHILNFEDLNFNYSFILRDSINVATSNSRSLAFVMLSAILAVFSAATYALAYLRYKDTDLVNRW